MLLAYETKECFICTYQHGLGITEFYKLNFQVTLVPLGPILIYGYYKASIYLVLKQIFKNQYNVNIRSVLYS